MQRNALLSVILIAMVVAPMAAQQAPVTSRRGGAWTASSQDKKQSSTPQQSRGGSLSDRLKSIQRSTAQEYSQPSNTQTTRRTQEPAPIVHPPADRSGSGGLQSVLKKPEPARTQPPVGSQPREPQPLQPMVEQNSRDIRVASRPIPGAATNENEESGEMGSVPAAPIHRPAPSITGTAQSIISQGALLKVEMIAPRHTILGKQATWEVVVLNQGTTVARDVIVQAALPAHATLATTSAATGVATQSTAGLQQTIEWQIDELVAGAETRLTIILVPTKPEQLDLQLGWAMKAQTVAAQVEVQQPMLAVEIDGPNEMKFGEMGTFNVTVSNPGTGAADGVTIQVQAGGSLSQPRQLGTLGPGETKTIPVDLTASQSGDLSISAKATANGDLNDSRKKSVVIRRAKLDVQLAGPQLQYAGTPITYELHLENSGDATADDIKAVFKLPAGAEVIAASKGAEASSGTISWKVGQLAVGTERVLKVQCKLSQPGPNRIDVAASSQDGQQVNDTLSTKVEVVADLKLTVNDPQGPQAVGSDVTYEIEIVNRGSKAATGVEVIAQFSDGVNPVSANGQASELLEDGQVVFSPIASIAPGQTVRLKVVARAVQGGGHRFRAEVICRDPETQLSAEETTRFFQ